MGHTLIQRVCSLLLTLMLFFSAGSSVAQNAGSGTNNMNASVNLEVANEDALRAEIKRLKDELTQLETQLPKKTKMETPLTEREAYVEKILDIMARLEALEVKLIEGNSQTAQGNGSGLALILKEIRYNKDIQNIAKEDEEITNTAGFGWERCSNDDCAKGVNETVAIQLEEYPRKIILGEPIHVKVKAVRRHVWKHGHKGGGFWHGYNFQPANVSVFFEPVHKTGSKPISLYFFGMGRKPLVIPKGATQPLDPNEQYPSAYTGWGDEDTLTLKLNLEYSGNNNKNSYMHGANYAVKKAESSGGFSKHYYSDPSPYDANNRVEIAYPFMATKPPLEMNDGKVAMRLEFAFHRPDQYGGKHIPETQKLILVYEFGGLDEEGLLASEFQMPDSLNESLESAMGDPAGTSSDDNSQANSDGPGDNNDNSNGDEDGSEDSNGNRDGTTSVADSENRSGNDDSQGNGENSPDNPNVQAIITEWLGVAEPPDNAKYGASLRYEKWGRVEGETPTGTSSVSGRPDEAAGHASHFTYLWSVRTRLDSVDHCTLGEYIEARLNQQGTSACASRYKPIIPDLVGKRGDTAKALLTQRKLKPVLKVAGPAPTQAKALTVERQDIPANSERRKGSPVTVWFYGPYIKTVVLSDYTGQQAAAAQKTLEQQGLKVTLKTGGEAPFSNKDNTVSAQSPSGGSSVQEGSEVVLTMYSPYIHRIVVPDVTGLTQIEAADRLKQSGFGPLRVQQGQVARQESLSNTVASTMPSAGSTVKAGTPVVMTIYRASSMVTMPNLVDMPLKQAQEKMLKVGLSADARTGKPAPESAKAGLVQGQFAKPGSRLKRGTRVTILIFGKHLPMVTMPNLVNLPVQTAVQRLSKLGLRADVKRGRAAKSTTQEGKVQGQYARPGSKLRKGDTVRLLAFGPAPRKPERKPEKKPETRTTSKPTPKKPQSSFNSSNGTRTRTNACGKTVPDAQKNDGWRKLPFHGQTHRGYRIQVHDPIAKARGVNISSAELYQNGKYLLHLAFYWLDTKTSQGVTTYQQGIARFKSKESKDRKFVLESADRYAFILTSPYTLSHAKVYPSGRSMTKSQLSSITCALLAAVEEQAASRKAGSKTTSTKTQPSTTYPGRLLPVDCSKRSCLGGPQHQPQGIYGLPTR